MQNPSLLLICNPENRRVHLFNEAAKKLGFSVIIVAYLDLLKGKINLEEKLNVVNFLRIESPGENFEVTKYLITLGLSENSKLTTQALEMPFEKGLIHNLKHWYTGFCKLIMQIENALKKFPNAIPMNTPSAIRLMFDKLACQQTLQEKGINIPKLWGQVQGYAHLQEIINQNHCPRLFLKASHSSSASGVMAYRKQGNKEQLMSHMLVEENGEQIKLYNTLKSHTYHDHTLIQKIINQMAQESIYAETWIPKANNQYGVYDFRILVVNGKAVHSVLRESQSPMTNLHLGNRRGDLKRLINELGESKWAEIQETAIKAVQAIPGAFYAGVDIMLSINLQKTYVLELNAFGDLLPGLLFEGKDTYEVELDCLLNKSQKIHA